MIPIQTEALFAIPLGITTISPDICDVLKTLQGSTQKEGRTNVFNVLDGHPVIKSDITNIFSLWANSLLGTPEQEWSMTTSWITLNPDGDEMLTHRHYNCMYSGVLYFDTIDTRHPALEFISPLTEASSFLITTPDSKLNTYNLKTRQVPINEGQMLFFPSYLLHGHPAFEPTDLVRKSFACNFFPIGKYGHYDSTIDTTWITH